MQKQKRTARATRAHEVERVVWQQGDKRVIRISADDYRAEVCGMTIGYSKTQFAAEQSCCNPYLYDALTKASVGA